MNAAIKLAGCAAELAWCRRLSSLPAAWPLFAAAGGYDYPEARDAVMRACGGDQARAERCYRQVWRLVADVAGCGPGTAADQRFMNLTMALTGVLRVVKVLSGKQARRVLRSADRGRT